MDGRADGQIDAWHFYAPPPPMASPWRGKKTADRVAVPVLQPF